MIRGKPKSPENLAKTNVKRAHYYSKKYPVVWQERLIRGNIAHEGRKKLLSEIAKNSIADAEIAKMFGRDIPIEVPLQKTAMKISAYALCKFGKQNRGGRYNLS